MRTPSISVRLCTLLTLGVTVLALSLTAAAQFGNQGSIQITQQPVVEYADAQTATIMWKTNTNASSVVRFGTDPNNLNQVAQQTWPSTTHRVQILNQLQPGQTYYFVVQSGSGLNSPDTIASPVLSFNTPQTGQPPLRNQSPTMSQGATVYGSQGNPNQYPAQSQPAYPQTGQGASGQESAVQIIQGPRIEYADDKSAVIAWSTNVNANTVVRYGTDPNRLERTARAPWGGTTHRVEIKGLQPGTAYYFRVVSGQAQGTGTRTRSDVLGFRTVAPGQAAVHNQEPLSASQVAQANLPQGDQSGNQPGNVQLTNGPVLEMVGDTSVVIAWSTNAPSSSVVRYGTDPNNLSQTAQAPWGSTDHRVTISNLQPATHYYFSVNSGQAQGTGTAAGTRTLGFTTVSQGAQPLRNQPPQ